MASIQKHGNKWRAQLTIKGERKSAVFDSEDAAKFWADDTTRRIKRISAIPTFGERMAAAQTLLVTALPKRVLNAIAMIPHLPEEILEAALPVASLVGIYFLVRDKEIVYVGQSGFDVLARVSKHRREGKEFDSFAFMHCHRESLNEYEAMYITALMPELNMSLGKVAFKKHMRSLAAA